MCALFLFFCLDDEKSVQCYEAMIIFLIMFFKEVSSCFISVEQLSFVMHLIILLIYHVSLGLEVSSQLIEHGLA